MRGRDIEIDRAHRVYDGGRGSDRPRTLIFRVLRWHDRSDILKGARQAYPVKCAQNNVTLLFFPDFSPATAIRRKAFGPVLKKMTALGLQPFLIYPAVIKLRHKGNREASIPLRKRRILSVPCLSRSPMPRSRGDDGGAAAAVSPVRREGRDGRDGLGPSCPEGDDSRMPWMLAKPIFCVFFSILGYCPYLSGTTISLLVRLTLHFFFGGD